MSQPFGVSHRSPGGREHRKHVLHFDCIQGKRNIIDGLASTFAPGEPTVDANSLVFTSAMGLGTSVVEGICIQGPRLTSGCLLSGTASADVPDLRVEAFLETGRSRLPVLGALCDCSSWW